MDSRYVVETDELACTVDRREPKKRDRASEMLRRMGGFTVPLVRDDWDAALRERLLPYTISSISSLVFIILLPKQTHKARTGTETRERRQSRARNQAEKQTKRKTAHLLVLYSFSSVGF
jgi:hypothetical protein